MKYIIQGQVITYEHKLIKRYNEETKRYIDKPWIWSDRKVEWRQIAEFDGELKYNNTGFSNFIPREHARTINCSENGDITFTLDTKSNHRNCFNLDEKTTVYIESETFRMDLNAVVVNTSKIISEEERSPALDSEIQWLLEKEIEAYNKSEIENDTELKDYCDLHNLEYEWTDVNKLREQVKGKSNTLFSGTIKSSGSGKIGGWSIGTEEITH